MPKRLALFFDGTWSTADQVNTTNVSKAFNATVAGTANGMEQLPFYDEGVGSRGNWLQRFLGGTAGTGLEQNIKDGYRFLIENHEDGDEIFLFGYSRGAYTARSLAGLIRNCGILRADQVARVDEAVTLYRSRGSGPDSDKAVRFKEQNSKVTDIKFIGVWDTVGARGIPLRFLGHLYNWRYRFHDVRLSSSVKNAYHALAIDEKRGPFTPSIWSTNKKEGQTVEQVWFAGVHGNVGGGSPDAGLSDITFQWMMDKARSCGLALDISAAGDDIEPNPAGTLYDSRTGVYKYIFSHERSLGRANSNSEAVHPSAVERFRSETPVYQPRNLRQYMNRPNPEIAQV